MKIFYKTINPLDILFSLPFIIILCLGGAIFWAMPAEIKVLAVFAVWLIVSFLYWSNKSSQ